MPDKHAVTILRLAQTDSTNTRLKELVGSGAQPGTVVIAEAQTGGRGRLGRSFCSQVGGLYLSQLLEPGPDTVPLTVVTPMAAVAVRRAVGTVCGLWPDIKWVNDLLLGGKKLCGILTQLVQTPTGENRIILGIGLNVAQDAFPPALDGIATSLKLQAAAPNLEAVTQAVLSQLQALAADLSAGRVTPWLEQYAAACVTLGREVTVIAGETRKNARATGLGPGGELLVTWPDGAEGVVNAGEVSVRGLDSYG